MAIRPQPISLGGVPIQIDYTARDYDTIRSEMLALASQLLPEWTDREPADMGVTIIEAMAYVADVLSYNLDRVQNESYLASAQTREAVVDLLRLIGYELSPASPASVNMVIQTNGTVTLPVGYKVYTQASTDAPSLEYRLPRAVTLTGAGYHCVSEETERTLRAFGATPIINDDLIFIAGEVKSGALGASNGLRDQSFIIPDSPVCVGTDDTSTIKVQVSGTDWEGRLNFIGTEPTDEVFVYRFLSSQEVVILFGDGVNGKVPPTGSAITYQCRIDGGSITNRSGVGAISNNDGTVSGVISVYNLQQPSGGSDPESITTAKKKGPLSLRALDRCVTLEDFEIMAKQTPGASIRSARAVAGDRPYSVDVYVATQGNNPIPTGEWFPLLNAGYGNIGAVGRYLSLKKPVPTVLNIKAPTVINPYFVADVYVYPNIIRETVKNDVQIALQQLFGAVTDEFGEGVALSAVIQAIENTKGVDYVNTTEFHRIPSAVFLGGDKDAFDASVLTVDGFTAQTTAAIYYIEFVNSATYTLRRKDTNEYMMDENGVRVLYATNQSHVVSEHNPNFTDVEAKRLEQFTINIQTNSPTPSAYDTWSFGVDNFLGNISAEPFEIVTAPIGSDGRLSSDQFRLTYLGGL
jgi:hypothetical protein